MLDRLRQFFGSFGPGVVTGASDDDPSGIATYAQTGTKFGYSPLWLVIFTVPLMIVVQEMCARIAIVTKKGLIHNLRGHVPMVVLWTLVLLLALANGMNAGADLGMMAASAHLVLPWFSVYVWLALFTIVTLGLQIFLSYQTYAKYLKWLTATLLCYVLVAFIVRVDWSAAFRATFLPVAWPDREFLLLVVAFLGTTISPYLYFWQANQEVEERIKQNPGRATISARLRTAFWDVVSGMNFSNVVAWFIILTGAAVLHAGGIRSLDTADQAARLLEPLAGRFASVIFALGTLATGLLAVPILTSVIAYASCEALGRVGGLSKTWKEARLFYGIVVLVTTVGALVNLSSIGPVRLLILSAVMNALIAPPMLYAIVWLGNAPLMRQYKNGHWSNALGSLTFVVMTIASLTGIYLLLF